MSIKHKTNKLKVFLIGHLLIIVLAASATVVNSYAYNLPEMGSSTELTLSQQDEKLLGEYIYQDINKQLPLVRNPFLDSYIQQLGDRLLSNSNTQYKDFKFFIIDSPIINAFALPGGYIAVNKGLITTADSEDEVAAVLAHEIAHVTQRHIARSIENQKQVQLPMIAGVVAGALLAAYSPELGQSIIAGSMAASTQSIINYTRSNEAEADRVGIYTLANSGYKPTSMAGFFNKLQQHSYADNDMYPEYLRTHPVNKSRITDARNRAEKIKFNKNTKQNNLNFYLVKSILQINNSKNLVQYVENNLLQTKSANISAEQRNIYKFNAAYALLQQDKFNQANNIFAELNKAYPKNNIIASLLAESYKNDNAKALTVLTKQLEISPYDIALSIQYAKTAWHNNKFNLAIDKLKQISKNVENYNSEIDLLLAQSYNKVNNKWHASLAYAEYSTKKGDLSAALMQLKATEKFDDLTGYQQKVVKHKIRVLEDKYNTRKAKLKEWL